MYYYNYCCFISFILFFFSPVPSAFIVNFRCAYGISGRYEYRCRVNGQPRLRLALSLSWCANDICGRGARERQRDYDPPGKKILFHLRHESKSQAFLPLFGVSLRSFAENVDPAVISVLCVRLCLCGRVWNRRFGRAAAPGPPESANRPTIKQFTFVNFTRKIPVNRRSTTNTRSPNKRDPIHLRI